MTAPCCTAERTYTSLRIQREVCTRIAAGFRPECSMARGAQPPLPEPPFAVPAPHPLEKLTAMDLRSGPWAILISRHEAISLPAMHHAASQDQPQEDNKTDNNVDGGDEHTIADSDSEAEAVRAWAQQNSPSDQEDPEEEPRFAL